MSLGTIHPNLYKDIAKEGKAQIQARNLNVSLFILSFLVVGSFMVSAALATYAAQLTITDNVDRINRTGTSNSVTWQINVTNQPGSANAITMVNITNATGYVITAWNATGTATDACTRYQLSLNCTGLNIAAGGQLRINVTTVQPGVSGERAWTVHTQDGDNVNTANTLYTAAIDGTDLAFDIYDELGNVTNESSVQLYNGSQATFDPGNQAFIDTDNNGLILIEAGNFTADGQQADTIQFNVTRKGFADRNQTTTRSDGTTTSYDPNAANVGWNNGFRPTGILYRIKITVTDELGNRVSDATINVTDLPILDAEGGMAQQSTTTVNHSSNGVYYFALRDAFDTVSFQVTRGGFLDNATFGATNSSNTTATVFRVNSSGAYANGTGSLQQTGNSTYVMPFKLKVTVQDELASGAVFDSGLSFEINATSATANRSSANVYYFSIPHANGVNVSVNRSGYVRTNTSEVAVNTTAQASITPQMPFRLKLSVIDETGAGAVFQDTTNTIIALNNTTSTANSTSTNIYYFNLTQSAVNVSVAKSGYINTTNATLYEVPLNGSTQAALIAHMNFSIRVTDLCNEIGGPSADGAPGHCYNIAGLSGGTHANISGTNSGPYNTTYSGGDAFINATNGLTASSIRINATRDGFVMSSLVVRVNQSTQVRLVFNSTDQTGTATDRGSGLPFTIKVLGVFDELGQRNFTLNNTASWGQAVGTTNNAGIDIVTQASNVFYDGPSAYVNATGTAAVEMSAFLGNQTMANSSIGVTPNNISQQTYQFSNSNTLGAGTLVNGLRYIFNITIGDELSQSTNFDTGVNVSFNGSVVLADKTVNSGGGWSYYFTNNSLPIGLAGMPNKTLIGVNRTGYINSTTDNVNYNSTNGTSKSFSLSFNLKVAVNDELSNAFTASAISFRANNSAVSQPNSTSGVYAYFALTPQFENFGGGYLINASEVGYVDNATSDTTLILVNSSTQALRNVTLLFTLKVPVRSLCDELNVTCLTIDGSTGTVGSGGISESGTGITNSTQYSGGIAYINATNGSAITLAAFGDGYINRTVSVFPNSNNQTFVVFNISNDTVDGVSAFRYVNASPLKFSIKVVSICDELNITCLNIDGILTAAQSSASEVGGNTTRYSGGAGYVAIRGTGPGRTPAAVTLNASGAGYVNVTNTSVTPQVANQINVSFNGTTTPLRYALKVTLQNELGGTTNMDTATLNVNATTGVGVNAIENRSFFRTASTSNLYYINVSNVTNTTATGLVNVSFSRQGYIYANQSNTLANASTQGVYTMSMPFAVKITTTDQSGSIYTGATVQIKDVSSNTWTVTDGNTTVDTLINSIAGANTSGSVGDNSTSSDGYIYLAINQSNVTNNVDVTILPNRNGYSDTFVYSKQINYTNQLAFSTGNVKDNTVPAAATSVTATASGKSFVISWTASTSNDVSHYRVYRNNTLLGTTSTTSFTDNPTTGDTTAPGAPSSVTAVALSSGGQINVSWTAPSNSIYVYNVTTVDTAVNLAATNGSASAVSVSPVASYRVFRNTTQLLGSTTTTAYTDSPSAGIYFYNVTSVSDAAVLSTTNGSSSTVDSRDTTAPAAATSVTATITTNNATQREVSVTWTASTSSDVSYYRIYRNDTLLGSSSVTSFNDNPNAGIFYYNVTTVDTSGNLASTNGTTLATTVFLGELLGPTINLTSPQANYNLTSTTPTISFTIIDNDGGVGVNLATVAVNISGFNATRDCTRNNDLNYTCSYTASSLTDAVNHTVSVAAKDKFGNAATNATRNFGVDTQDGITTSLIRSTTSGIADNTYANGWTFTFNVTLGSTVTNATQVNATAVRVSNWTRIGGTNTIPTSGNTIMNYTISNGTSATYYVSDNYNTTDTIYPLQDGDSYRSLPINGTVTIQVKVPTSTTPGTYSTTFTFGSWSIALTGGNPT